MTGTYAQHQISAAHSSGSALSAREERGRGEGEKQVTAEFCFVRSLGDVHHRSVEKRVCRLWWPRVQDRLVSVLASPKSVERLLARRLGTALIDKLA